MLSCCIMSCIMEGKVSRLPCNVDPGIEKRDS